MGDEVRFRYGADWLVIGFQNDNRIVEIEAVKDGQQQTFRRSVTQIRPVDAPLNAPPGSLAAMRKELPKSATQMRTWSISDGRISFDGQLTGYDDGWISLLRQDGKTVRVQIVRLSAGDQTFLQGIGAATAEPPKTNSPVGRSSLLPELTSMATEPTIEFREMRPVGPIDPDPTPFAFDLPEFETLSLPEASISATTSSALLVDGPRGRLVYSQTTDDGGSPSTAFTLIDIASKATKEIAAFPSSAITLLAADPTGGRAIAVTDFQESNDQAALVWIGGVASGKPSLDTRWPIPENGEGKPMKIRLAFLTPASIAIVQCDDQLFAWDLLRRKTLWRIQGNQALVAITAGGRYLAAQTGRIVGVIDVASGRQLRTVKLKNQFPAGLAFAPDSARLAVSQLNHLQVYDLQDWSIESELDMRVAPQNAYAVSAWLDEQNLMLAGGLIVRPEEHWVIWNYDIKTGRVDRFETLPYGFYSNFYRIGRQSTLLMTSLPHAPVQKLISQRTTSGDRPLAYGSHFGQRYLLSRMHTLLRRECKSPVFWQNNQGQGTTPLGGDLLASAALQSRGQRRIRRSHCGHGKVGHINNKPHNEAKRAALSNLGAIMGRAAVHTGKTITWDEAMASTFQFFPNVADLTADSPAPRPSRRRRPLPSTGPGRVVGNLIARQTET